MSNRKSYQFFFDLEFKRKTTGLKKLGVSEEELIANSLNISKLEGNEEVTLTQEEMASMLNIDVKTYRNIEKNNSTYDEELAKKIGKIFNLEINLKNASVSHELVKEVYSNGNYGIQTTINDADYVYVYCRRYYIGEIEINVKTIFDILDVYKNAEDAINEKKLFPLVDLTTFPDWFVQNRLFKNYSVINNTDNYIEFFNKMKPGKIYPVLMNYEVFKEEIYAQAHKIEKMIPYESMRIYSNFHHEIKKIID